MEKIIVTKEEFMETAAKVISEIMDRHEDSLGLVLMGTVVIGELTEGLFKEQDSIELDEENYYNFTLTHNSEFWLSNGKVDELEKVSAENKEDVKDKIEDNKNNIDTTKQENNVNNNTTTNPRTGDNIILFVSIATIKSGLMSYSFKSFKVGLRAKITNLS